jgi:hypothetical protein
MGFDSGRKHLTCEIFCYSEIWSRTVDTEKGRCKHILSSTNYISSVTKRNKGKIQNQKRGKIWKQKHYTDLVTRRIT